jgi:ribosomal protein L37AE/L43A
VADSHPKRKKIKVPLRRMAAREANGIWVCKNCRAYRLLAGKGYSVREKMEEHYRLLERNDHALALAMIETNIRNAKPTKHR